MTDNLQSDNIGEITKALASFQETCPILEFDGEASIKGVSAKGKDYEYKYQYLTLPKLRKDTKDILSKCELAKCLT